MFDEEADEVIAPDETDAPDEASTDIQGFCARCKGDTPHTVVSRYQDEIRRVRCNSCEDIHAYRRPRSDKGDDSGEPQEKGKTLKAKPTWEQVRSKNTSVPQPYNGDEVYCDLDVITHPVFGVGFVSELIGQNKVEITFQSDKRILIHNRKLLPLHVVQRQRKEVAAQVKAADKAAAREAKDAKAAAREAAQMAKAHTIDDLDMPDELTDMPVPMRRSKSTKLSPRALEALEEKDGDDYPAENFDEESGGSERSKGRKNKTRSVTAAEPEAHEAAANKSANIAPGSGQDKKNTSLRAAPAPATKPAPAATPAPAAKPAPTAKPAPATKPAPAAKPAAAAKPAPATKQSRRIDQK